MNKKILISLSIILAVAAIVVSGTVAYLSDTETSAGNIFTAGAIDLKIDNTCHFDGMICALQGTAPAVWVEESEDSSTYPELIGKTCDCSWLAKDMDGNPIFNFADIKPGDNGESTISLHVDSNPAWICAEVTDVTQKDNGCNEPELKAEIAAYGAGNETCNDSTPDQGELFASLKFNFWMDNGAIKGHACNNKKDTDETYVQQGINATNLKYAIADASTGGQPIVDSCVGVEWSVPYELDNIAQTDGVTGNLVFKAIQARHNESFVCNPVQLTCGDGIVTSPEVCEGAMTQACSAEGGYAGTQSCVGCQWSECQTTLYCGDGLPGDSEVCDEGSVLNGTPNHCNANCTGQTAIVCGNGVIESGETCDNGTENNITCTPEYGGSCTFCEVGTCQPITFHGGYCGDMIINGSEQCDDGNTSNQDYCSNSCQSQGALTVHKTIVNNNGGTLEIGGVVLNVDDSTVSDGQTVYLLPGTHNFGEEGIIGYAATYAAPCDAFGNVVITANNTVSCTLTNDDVAPSLRLVVTPANSAKPTIDGGVVTSGATYPMNANQAYIINETTFASGYSFDSISGPANCPLVLGGTITLDLATNITCTITNTQIPQ